MKALFVYAASYTLHVWMQNPPSVSHTATAAPSRSGGSPRDGHLLYQRLTETEENAHVTTARYFVKASRARGGRWVVFVPALDVWTIVDNADDIQTTAERMITDTIGSDDFTTGIEPLAPIPGSERDADDYFRNMPGMKRWPSTTSEETW
jgi:hypothetical protein